LGAGSRSPPQKPADKARLLGGLCASGAFKSPATLTVGKSRPRSRPIPCSFWKSSDPASLWRLKVISPSVFIGTIFCNAWCGKEKILVPPTINRLAVLSYRISNSARTYILIIVFRLRRPVVLISKMYIPKFMAEFTRMSCQPTSLTSL